MATRKFGRGRGRYPGALYPNDVSTRFSNVQYDNLDKSAGKLDISMTEVLRRLVDEDLPKLAERERVRRRRARK